MKGGKMVVISFLCLLLNVANFACNTNGKIKEKNSAGSTTGDISESKIKTGDIIFQSSLSGQGKAIQLATGSPLTHCGIIFQKENRWYVFEAVQPVKLTPLDTWINRGVGGKYIVKRLKEADKILTPEMISAMEKTAKQFLGKDYDKAFEWTDDRIYCSELVWKLYQRTTGLEIGKLQKLSDFNLTSNIVKEKLKERYGNNIPLNEMVISPVSIFNSDLLIEETKN